MSQLEDERSAVCYFVDEHAVFCCVQPSRNKNQYFKKTEILWLNRKPSQHTLQVSSNTLQQVEKLKYYGFVFTSDGRRKKEIDTGISEVNAILREFHPSTLTKRELSNAAKLSVF